MANKKNVLKRLISSISVLGILMVSSGVGAQSFFVDNSGLKDSATADSRSTSFISTGSLVQISPRGESTSYFVSASVFGGGEAEVTPPPTPEEPTPPELVYSGSGGGGRYDASNWILERKYDELVAIRDEDGPMYTSAPKKTEPLLPMDLDKIERVGEFEVRITEDGVEKIIIPGYDKPLSPTEIDEKFGEGTAELIIEKYQELEAKRKILESVLRETEKEMKILTWEECLELMDGKKARTFLVAEEERFPMLIQYFLVGISLGILITILVGYLVINAFLVCHWAYKSRKKKSNEKKE